MWVFVYPQGSASELLDGTLKLRHCTAIFTMRFLPWSLPRVGNGGGTRWYVTLGHLPDDRSNVGKRVRLTRKTRPDVLALHNPDPEHPTPRRWKRLRPLPSKERRVRWACLAIFFLALGLGEVCAGDAWNLSSEGTGAEVFRLVSPAEGAGALALALFEKKKVARGLRVWTDTRVMHTVRTTTTTTTTTSPTPPHPVDVRHRLHAVSS